jgi:hypothetical protein
VDEMNVIGIEYIAIARVTALSNLLAEIEGTNAG